MTRPTLQMTIQAQEISKQSPNTFTKTEGVTIEGNGLPSSGQQGDMWDADRIPSY